LRGHRPREPRARKQHRDGETSETHGHLHAPSYPLPRRTV